MTNERNLLNAPDLSLIVPCHNEAGNVRLFFETAYACFDEAGINLELVFIDDGSADDTMSVLRSIVEEQRESAPSWSSDSVATSARKAACTPVCRRCAGEPWVSSMPICNKTPLWR